MTLRIGPADIIQPGMWGLGWYEGYPVSGDITSLMGPRAPIAVPGGFTSSYHGGVDISAPGGRPVIFPADLGEVVAEGPAWNGYGNVVIIKSGDYHLFFAHLQPGLHVGVGQVLQRGQVVGQVGTTGASTGNHLHFAVAELLPGITIRDINYYVDTPFWRDPLSFVVHTLPGAEVFVEPAPAADLTPQWILDFQLNSIKALAANPPADMGAALAELGKRIEYLKSLI